MLTQNSLVAEVGDTIGGKTLTSLGLSPSINNNGDVAFLGSVSGGGGIITASKPPSCGAGTIQQGNKCTPNLNAICGAGTMISGLQCIALGMQAVGGIFVEIDTLAVLGAAVGVDPLITGLVVITMVGITGQAAWFIHRRKKKSSL